MDCRKLTYEDESFDIIIDKSTLDCLMCGATAELDVCQMIKEIQRILKTNGLYVIISLESSENREFIFEMPHLSFEVEYIQLPISNNIQHYMYILRKLDDANIVCQNHYDEHL